MTIDILDIISDVELSQELYLAYDMAAPYRERVQYRLDLFLRWPDIFFEELLQPVCACLLLSDGREFVCKSCKMQQEILLRK